MRSRLLLVVAVLLLLKRMMLSRKKIDRLVHDMTFTGGIITKEDLEKYHVKWRDPYPAELGDYLLLTTPPPFGGPIYQFILKLMNSESLYLLNTELNIDNKCSEPVPVSMYIGALISY